jgi:uncharacterized protein YjbI with pentapeptide repeats
LPKCKFTTQYYDYEIRKRVDFNCQGDPLASGFCIFHDKDYLQDKTNYEEHKRNVLQRLKHKVNHATSNNETLLCIGFQLPDFCLSELSNSENFTKPVYFNCSQFLGKADFTRANFQVGANFSYAKFQGIASFSIAKFQGEANFSEAKFKGGANFIGAKFQVGAYFNEADFQVFSDFRYANFQGEASFYKADFDGVYTRFSNSEFYRKTIFSGHFNSRTTFYYVLFEGKEKVIFNTENLSNVSFMNTDMTGVRFSDKTRWGRNKVKEDRFKIVDERLLEDKIKEKDGHTTKDFNLGSIKAVYRNLRENYEYRMRYDEAGQFLIREMELKRMYKLLLSLSLNSECTNN